MTAIANNLESLNYSVPNKKYNSFSELQVDATKFAYAKVKKLTSDIIKLSECDYIVSETSVLMKNTTKVKTKIVSDKKYANYKLVALEPFLMANLIAQAHLQSNEQYITGDRREEVRAFYSSIMNGLKFALFPPKSMSTTDQSSQLVNDIASIEQLKLSKETVKDSQIISKIALKVAETFVKIAIEQHPISFKNTTDLNPDWKWSAKKVTEVIS